MSSLNLAPVYLQGIQDLKRERIQRDASVAEVSRDSALKIINSGDYFLIYIGGALNLLCTPQSCMFLHITVCVRLYLCIFVGGCIG